jgi:type I site-specific restriction endonuclease
VNNYKNILLLMSIVIWKEEAKPEGTGVPGIIAQDERYSRNYNSGKFDFDGYHIPFLYSSNGHLIWYRDVRSKNNLYLETLGL